MSLAVGQETYSPLASVNDSLDIGPEGPPQGIICSENIGPLRDELLRCEETHEQLCKKQSHEERYGQQNEAGEYLESPAGRCPRSSDGLSARRNQGLLPAIETK